MGVPLLYFLPLRIGLRATDLNFEMAVLVGLVTKSVRDLGYWLFTASFQPFVHVGCVPFDLLRADTLRSSVEALHKFVLVAGQIVRKWLLVRKVGKCSFVAVKRAYGLRPSLVTRVVEYYARICVCLSYDIHLFLSQDRIRIYLRLSCPLNCWLQEFHPQR